MQRYPSAGGGVANSTITGASVRDTARADSSFSSSNYPLNTRRTPQLAPYKLKCDKEPLSGRLGAPDFYPQTVNCPEETLTREYLQSGYKETVDGIEEAKEIVLTQVGYFTKPVVLKCKEAIRKHLRAINESRAQKRKAGQIYGVPLSGSLLVKPGIFPEQRSSGEDSRRKWIEGLSQYNKELSSLADHVPHGYRKKFLIEVIIRYNVPILRATWFIKVNYLNQIRPNLAGVSSGAHDKLQTARTELWTKDVIEYMQYLLDDFFAKNGLYTSGQSRDQPSPSFVSSPHQRTDPLSIFPDGNDPPLLFKWQYMVQLLKWHCAEGLLFPSFIIEWAMIQLQEKATIDVLELVLPIIIDLMHTVQLSQTYVRMFAEIALQFLNNLCPGITPPVVNIKKSHLTSVLVEVLRHLLLAVPDAFVGLDCFPLPISVAPNFLNGKGLDAAKGKIPIQKSHEDTIKIDPDQQIDDAYHRYLSFGHVASSLHRRASNLAKIVNPSLQGLGVSKLLQALDKASVQGEIKGAYCCLFEELSDTAIDGNWITDVSPCLRHSLKWIKTVNSSLISSIFFLLEWATCDFRDFRNFRPLGVKFTGRKDISSVYVAVTLLKLKMENMYSLFQTGGGSSIMTASVKPSLDGLPGETTMEDSSAVRGSPRSSNTSDTSDILESPSPLHDIIVCWLDQHEVRKGEGFKRVEVLMMELIRHGIFYPQVYVRQLIISGILDVTDSQLDQDRQRRHLRIVKQMPGSYMYDIVEESKIGDEAHLHETLLVYTNERKLVLGGLCGDQYLFPSSRINGSLNSGHEKERIHMAPSKSGAFPSFSDIRKNVSISSTPPTGPVKSKGQVTELKALISALLHFPHQYSLAEEQSSRSDRRNKRHINSLAEMTPGCEECTKSKRQKLSEDMVSHLPVMASNQSDDEDIWWVRKGSKSLETLKTEQPPKSNKPVSRGRQKSVRKMQSLSQLAAARIEGSQGASTSHVCDSKISCPHHMSSNDGVFSLPFDGMKADQLVNIGRAVKKLRWTDKRCLSIWLWKSVKFLIEENESSMIKGVRPGGPFSPPTEERGVVRWKLGEKELLSILYLLDISLDMLLTVKLLVWLLPKVTGVPPIHLGRNNTVLSKNSESSIDVGEAFLLASLQRYENVLVTADLLPESLSAAMNLAATQMAPHVRPTGVLSFIYAQNLLKKYGKVNSVAKWEKSFRASSDQRLLAEFESGRSLDADLGYSLGIPAGVEDLDDYIRQKIGSSKMPSVVPSLREIVQRQVDDAVYGKERKIYGATSTKSPTPEKWDDAHQVAQKIVLGFLDCLRQNGVVVGQEWDPSGIVAAVSAIVRNVGLAFNNCQNFSSSTSSLECIRHIVHIHIACLRLLKESVGERFSRVFENSFAAEASLHVSAAFAPVKPSRGQFQLSPEMHDMNQNISNDSMNNSKLRALKASSAVSALVVGSIIHGVSSLERMISVFRLKDGLDLLQFIRSMRSNSNGTSRSVGSSKLDYQIETCVHWFRLLIGNCRTVLEGLVSEVLGEAYTLALSRLQRTLPLKVVFPPAYSIFAMIMWRPYFFTSNIASRDDNHLYQHLSVAIGDAIRHQPFRDVLLRDSQTLYDLVASDLSESEFASMLESHNLDKHLHSSDKKIAAFVPLRARLFLNAIVDCRMPPFTTVQDDGSWIYGHGEARRAENETKLLDQVLHVLDTLQPAKFHWQWIELRLLLNEQALKEKIESHTGSLAEAIRSLSPTAENAALSENESTFIEVVLTRLLVRPDAASLYSEVLHLLGRSLDDKLLLNVKWLLAGNDVLLGRKSICQRLNSVAKSKGLLLKGQCWKPWGWSSSITDVPANRADKRKLEVSSLEEGEVVEDGAGENKRSGRSPFQMFDGDGFNVNQHYMTDKALAELVFPCIDRSSNESRCQFAADLIKQLNNIDLYINSYARTGGKQTQATSATAEASANKGGNRKGMRGGSPGMGRRLTSSKDQSPASVASLRASIWLRMQFLLRLLSVIYSDREPSTRNLRRALASVLLHLLGTQVVYDDTNLSFNMQRSSPKRESETSAEAAVHSSLELSGDSLFDRILSVFHGLLSGCKPSWLKAKSISKANITKSPRDSAAFDRDVVEVFQADLDRMLLPVSVRRRIQAAMPVLPPPTSLSVSCHPPMVSPKLLSSLQLMFSTSGGHEANPSTPQRNASTRNASNVAAGNKPSLSFDSEIEIDPWTLLEDGTSSSNNASCLGSAGGDHSNLRACYWLKGAVRIRRSDLTYIGATDEDS